MYYVYVLRSRKDNQFYTGFAEDLKKRLDQHNKGYVEATRDRTPLDLIYYEACLSKYDAFKREKYLKTSYGKRYLKNRLKDSLANYSTGQCKE